MFACVYFVFPGPNGFFFILLCSSSGDADELAAAGIWLYMATRDNGYLNDAKTFYPAGTAWGFNWNDANVGAAVSRAASGLSAAY